MVPSMECAIVHSRGDITMTGFTAVCPIIEYYSVDYDL